MTKLLLVFLALPCLCLAETNYAKVMGLTDLRIVDGKLYDLSKAKPITGELRFAGERNAVLVNEWVRFDRSMSQNGDPRDMLRVLASLKLGQRIPPNLQHYTVTTREEFRVSNFSPKVKLGSIISVRAVLIQGSDWDCGTPFKGDIHEHRICYIPTPKGKTGLPIPTREQFAEKLQADKDKIAAAKKRAEDFRKAKEELTK